MVGDWCLCSLNAALSKGTGAGDVRENHKSLHSTQSGQIILHGSETQGDAVISILAKA